MSPDKVSGIAPVLHRPVKVVTWEFGVDQLEGFTTICIADHVLLNLRKVAGRTVAHHQFLVFRGREVRFLQPLYIHKRQDHACRVTYLGRFVVAFRQNRV